MAYPLPQVQPKYTLSRLENLRCKNPPPNHLIFGHFPSKIRNFLHLISSLKHVHVWILHTYIWNIAFYTWKPATPLCLFLHLNFWARTPMTPSYFCFAQRERFFIEILAIFPPLCFGVNVTKVRMHAIVRYFTEFAGVVHCRACQMTPQPSAVLNALISCSFV